MVKRFLKASLKKGLKNRTIVLLSLILALLIAFSIYLFHTPQFPGNTPSSEKTQQSTQIHKSRTDLFNRYTQMIRKHHEGLIIANEVNRITAKPKEDDPALVEFLHQYKFFHKEKVFNLTKIFSKQNGFKLSIKRKKAAAPTAGSEESYLFEFIREGKCWVKVRVETVKSHALSKTGQQYEENLSAYGTVYVDDKKEMDTQDVNRLRKNGKLVIIIDDMGNNLNILHKLISLDFDITYSILPLLQHTEETAQIVHSAKREIMLHLPMEPKDWPKYNPGPGALYRSDGASETQLKLAENLSSVNYAVGVNNHMGSSYTQYGEGMDIVMEKLSGRKLFFIDSKTSPGNTVKNSASRFGVPYLSRNIFLDNFQSEPYIKKQLFKAVRIAQKRGKAIAIGHPHLATFKVLKAYLPRIQESGTEIAKASALLEER